MNKKLASNLIFSLLSITAAISFWLSWINRLEFSLEFSNFVGPFLATVFLVITLNAIFFLDHRQFTYGTILISSVIPLAVYRDFRLYAWLASLAFSAGLLLSYSFFKRDLTLYKKLSFIKLSQAKNIFMAISLSLSLVTVGKQDTGKNDLRLEIPDRLFSEITKLTNQLLGSGSLEREESTLSMAGKAFDREIPNLENQLRAGGITDEKIVGEKINEARINYLSQVRESARAAPAGIATEDQVLTLKKSFESEINAFLDNYRSFFPYVFGLSFFLTISIFSPLIVLLSGLATVGLLKIFASLGLFSVKKRNEEVEFIEI